VKGLRLLINTKGLNNKMNDPTDSEYRQDSSTRKAADLYSGSTNLERVLSQLQTTYRPTLGKQMDDELERMLKEDMVA
jgi:hypothetical protein